MHVGVFPKQGRGENSITVAMSWQVLELSHIQFAHDFPKKDELGNNVLGVLRTDVVLCKMRVFCRGVLLESVKLVVVKSNALPN